MMITILFACLIQVTGQSDRILSEAHEIKVDGAFMRNAFTTTYRITRHVRIGDKNRTRFHLLRFADDSVDLVALEVEDPNGQRTKYEPTLHRLQERRSDFLLGFGGGRVAVVPGLQDGSILIYTTQYETDHAQRLFQIAVGSDVPIDKLTVSFDFSKKLDYIHDPQVPASQRKRGSLSWEITDIAAIPIEPFAPNTARLRQIVIQREDKATSDSELLSYQIAGLKRYRNTLSLDDLRLARQLKRDSSSETDLIQRILTYVSRDIETKAVARSKRLQDNDILKLNYAHPNQKVSLCWSLLESVGVDVRPAFAQPNSDGRADREHLTRNALIPILILGSVADHEILVPYLRPSRLGLVPTQMLGSDYVFFDDAKSIQWRRAPLENTENSVQEQVEFKHLGDTLKCSYSIIWTGLAGSEFADLLVDSDRDERDDLVDAMIELQWPHAQKDRVRWERNDDRVILEFSLILDGTTPKRRSLADILIAAPTTKYRLREPRSLDFQVLGSSTYTASISAAAIESGFRASKTTSEFGELSLNASAGHSIQMEFHRQSVEGGPQLAADFDLLELGYAQALGVWLLL